MKYYPFCNFLHTFAIHFSKIHFCVLAMSAILYNFVDILSWGRSFSGAVTPESAERRTVLNLDAVFVSYQMIFNPN